MDHITNIFSILIGFVIFGLLFYILKAEISQSLEILSSSYMSEYKSIVSLLLLLIIVLVLLLLAITCTYSRFLQILGMSEQAELQHSQIFFNLIQLNVDNFIDSNGEVSSEQVLEVNPPDYNSVVIESELNTSLKPDSSLEGEAEGCLESPPSYEAALNRSQNC